MVERTIGKKNGLKVEGDVVETTYIKVLFMLKG